MDPMSAVIASVVNVMMDSSVMQALGSAHPLMNSKTCFIQEKSINNAFKKRKLKRTSNVTFLKEIYHLSPSSSSVFFRP